MVKLCSFLCVLLASSISAFSPAAVSRVSTALNLKAEVDNTGNNIALKNLLNKVNSSGVLTKVAEAGLLSKAQASGVTLSSLEPLLKAVGGNQEAMVLLEAATPELLALPILPKVIEFAPSALPLLSAAISVPTIVIQLGGVASLASAAAAVTVIPDDTILEIAAQTILVATLGVLIPAVSAAGSVALSKARS